MGYKTILNSFRENYIFKVIKEDCPGLLSKKAVTLRHGMTLWKSGEYYWVLRYPATMVMSSVLFICILIHHVLNFRSYSLVAKIFEYAYPVAAIVYAISINSRRERIGQVSRVLDQWYRYPFLDKTMNELKKNAEKKTKRFYDFYYIFQNIGISAYCLMPAWHYYQNPAEDASNLLIFQCWTPLPMNAWWGFALTYLMELSIIINIFIVFGYFATFLTAWAITAGYQCRLIGISLRTIEERVGKAMVLQNIVRKERGWEEAEVWAMKKELRNSVIHYQTVFGLTKEVCEFFIGPISICYYPGIFVLVICCGRLATEYENKYLLLQAAFMINAVLVNQYIIAFINQMITDEFEKLQLAVYDSPWYKMKVPCRKMVHIMQTMMLRKPNIRTILGTKANMEFFATVINASYCYLSALSSMNIKY